jgi:hypothetical protein
MLEVRLGEDLSMIATVIRDRDSGPRYARQLLHRLSETLAFALLCECASDGSNLSLLAAERYHEELAPPRIGGENEQVTKAALELIEGAR